MIATLLDPLRFRTWDARKGSPASSWEPNDKASGGVIGDL